MKMNRTLFFALGMLLAAAPARGARYALLVGCNDGGGSVERLKYSEADAERFAGLLIKLGGFESAAVVTLLRPGPGALDTALRAARETLRSSKSPDNDLFLFYYSGHADGTDLLLGRDRYPLGSLRRFLDSLPSGVRIGVFDACQSGAVVYKGGRRAEPFYLKSSQKIKGEVLIASTAAGEHAQESESLKGSVFSFYWLSGLRGSADASGDRRVTLNEAYNYAYRKTVEASVLSGGEAQHPVYRFTIHGEGDITLTDLTDPAGGIVFDKSCEGKFLVLSDSYTDIFADFFKKKNSEYVVSLDPGSYTAVNANGGEVGMYGFSVRPGAGPVRLAQSMLVPNAFTESRIKGANAIAQLKMTEPSSSPLSTHSWGIGAGAHALSATGTNGLSRGLSFSFANLFYINDHVDLFFDCRYFTGGLNVGADIGFDYTRPVSSSGYSIGAGAGLFYSGEKDRSFEDALAPALTARLGFFTGVGERSRFVIQVPYTATFGSATAHRLGVEIRLLFTGRYKDIKVLHYD